MSKKKDKKVVAELFGEVKKKEATGGHIVDLSKITSAFKDEGVLRTFCTGCGSYSELTQQGTQKLANENEVQLPSSLSGAYFAVTGCTQCAEDFFGVVFHEKS